MNTSPTMSLFSAKEKDLLIHAFASCFFSTYYIDLTTHQYREIEGSTRIRRALTETGHSEDAIAQFVDRIVDPDHRPRMHAFVDTYTLAQRMQNKFYITEQYRNIYGIWCMAVFISVNTGENGCPDSVILGTYTINNEKNFIDQQRQQIEDRTAVISALSEDFYSVYLADLNANTALQLRVSDVVDHEYGDSLRGLTNYENVMDMYIQKSVHPADRESLIRFSDRRNLIRLLQTELFVSQDYRVVRDGSISFFQIKIVKLSGILSDNKAVIGFAPINRSRARQLEHYAYVDEVTGGDNYVRFKEKLKKQPRKGYLLSMNIHNFKMINSICGSDTGDKVLKNIWFCIQQMLLPGELAGHINADRFSLFLQDAPEEEIEQRLLELAQTFKNLAARMHTPQIIPYIGVVHYESGPQDEIEMYYSKAATARNTIRNYKDRIVSFFSQQNEDLLVEQEKLEEHFPEALQNREFKVWFQPQFSDSGKTIVGAEALCRWILPDGQMIQPGNFIPLFERDGLIYRLDEYIFTSVCEWQSRRIEKGLRTLPVSVNLSRASLYIPDVVGRYQTILQSYSLPPALVPLEVTESAMVENKEISEVIREFSMRGFVLHLDDFGSGYSSLATMNMVQFDTIKLDKSLIDYIGNYKGDRLLSHIISLTRELGIRVIAEGVETKEQAQFLEEQGCTGIQGFLYAKPMAKEAYEQLLDV